MDFVHVPVLLNECIENLALKAAGTYVDGTLGGGGHSAEIAAGLGAEGLLIGIDRDADAIEAAAARLGSAECRLMLKQGNYADIREILSEAGIDRIDGALLDLGVSSFQLDSPDRGFSYMREAPLDMRMDRSSELSAFDVVNGYPRERLAALIRGYGEERWASRIAAFIDEARQKAPLGTTTELVEVIKKAIPAGARREGPHPAKRTFQAIRIEVNDELTCLREALEDFIGVLAPGGRLCVISFHSLEDRIVKESFAKHSRVPCGPRGLPPPAGARDAVDVKRITVKPIAPTEAEKAVNPRARSARLRVIEKL